MHQANPAIEELETLARTSGWVLPLARRLVGDAHLAEDVVQDAYVEALEASEASPRWLGGVVRNLARSTGRDRGRRRQREQRSARDEALESTADNVARLEQQTLLIQALLGLEQVYRTAIVLRYVDGLPPRTIAEQLHVPVATVNSQLARGLDQLRTALCAAHGGDRSRWLAAFAPLLQPPSHVGAAAVSTATVAAPLPLVLGALVMKTKILAVAALVVVALTVRWGLEDLQSGTLDSDGSPTADLALDDEQVERAAPLALVAPDAASNATAIPAPHPDSVLAATGEVATVSVRAIDALSGDPLPGTELFVLDWSASRNDLGAMESLALQANLPWSGRDLVRGRSERFVTDSEGRAVVPLHSDTVQILAQHETSFCTDHLREGRGEHVLELLADKPLTVRVVDERGRPLEGVPVILASRLEGRLFPLSSAVTAPRTSDGEVVAQLAWSTGYPDSFNDTLCVALDFPLSEPVRGPIAFHPWPDETLTLECPPLATVVVRARMASGDAVADDVIVHLAPSPPGAELPEFAGSERLARVTRDGEVRFWPVGLDVPLVAAVWLHGSMSPTRISFQGPHRAGQTLEVDLVDDGMPLRLFGRLLEHDGEPSAEVEFYFATDSQQDTGLPPVAMVTEADGSFEFQGVHFPDRPLGGPFQIVNYAAAGPRTLRGVLPEITAAVLEAGELDLGALRLEAPPIPDPAEIVTGRVFGPDGNPVTGATVQWAAWTAAAAGEGQPHWVQSGAMGMTLGDGSFQIFNQRPSPDAHLQVRPRHNLHHTPVAVPAGAADIELHMVAGASLVGSVLLDDGIGNVRLAIDLWNEVRGPAPRRSDTAGWRSARIEEHNFTFDGLAPGSYTVRVGASSESTSIAITGIQVTGTEDVRDPRLDPVDLTGRYRVIDLRVVDRSGGAVQGRIYAFDRGMSKQGQPRITGPRSITSTGRGPFLSEVEVEHALVVEAEGFFPVSLDPAQISTEAPTVVTLERGLEVKLDWTSTPLAELPFDLVVQLQDETPDEAFGGRGVRHYLRRWSPARGRLSEQASTTALRVPGPGTYRLLFETDYEYKDGYHMNRKVELSDAVHVVVSQQQDSVYAVSLPDAVLEREVAWMRERFEEEKARGYVSPETIFGEKQR